LVADELLIILSVLIGGEKVADVVVSNVVEVVSDSEELSTVVDVTRVVELAIIELLTIVEVGKIVEVTSVVVFDEVVEFVGGVELTGRFWKTLSLLPAPQSSWLLPGQAKLQSVSGAGTDPIKS
jgi:hypothetical protein